MAGETSTPAALCTNYVAAGNPPFSFPDAVAMEGAMLERTRDAGAQGIAPDAFAIWQTEQAIILPSGMSKKYNIERAQRATERIGWPIFERRTGGDVTPQFEGVLNVSMSFLLAENGCNITTAYERLTEPVVAFLKASRGVDAYMASVKGAFCDGAHNIVVDGKKLGGTAQRWRRLKTQSDGPAPTAVLGHIALLCGGALDEALAASNLFFEEAEIPRRINPTVHVTIADLDGKADTDIPTLASELTDFINARA